MNKSVETPYDLSTNNGEVVTYEEKHEEMAKTHTWTSKDSPMGKLILYTPKGKDERYCRVFQCA